MSFPSWAKIYHADTHKDKKTKEIDIDTFVGIKNWKAIGNKLIGYNRLSSFKIIEKSESSNNNSESLELTLF